VYLVDISIYVYVSCPLRSLGLYGGAERLPSIAFNTKDHKQIPFSEKLSINRETLLQFCADFISGKLKSASDAEELAKKQLLAAKPLSTKNMPKRKPVKKAPKQVTGVSEQFGDGNKGDKSVKIVNSKNFEDVVMDETKDVLIMFHSQACESCSHFSGQNSCIAFFTSVQCSYMSGKYE
jgi:hypothetical protein